MDGLNTVKVLSIDEERLKFRVIFSVDATTVSGGNANAAGLKGDYQFNMPPLTSFGNSRMYESCTVDCDSFVAYNPIGTNDAVWTNGAAFARTPAVELIMDTGGSQSSMITQLVADQKGFGQAEIGGCRQLVPLVLQLTGDGAGAIAGAQSHSWQGSGAGEPLMCGNPFGKSVRLSIVHPELNNKVYLVSQAQGVGDFDRGIYIFQFTFTMIPNQ